MPNSQKGWLRVRITWAETCGGGSILGQKASWAGLYSVGGAAMGKHLKARGNSWLFHFACLQLLCEMILEGVSMPHTVQPVRMGLAGYDESEFLRLLHDLSEPRDEPEVRADRATSPRNDSVRLRITAAAGCCGPAQSRNCGAGWKRSSNSRLVRRRWSAPATNCRPAGEWWRMSAITSAPRRIGNSFGESGRPRPAHTLWPICWRKTTPESTSRDRNYREPRPASPGCCGISSGAVASTSN